ncbi:MAG TPA: acyl-CoA dehydrogenase family protein [Mycobacteriales bacterium]|nr:acyl-CoA dehydrogenase family protein [Mycobacteriales bacterium]
MLVALSSDQEALRSTTARFLDDRMPVATIRGLRDEPAGYPDDYWTQAAGLGWTALLVSDEHGGGSLSGAPLTDLSLIAYEIGLRAAPGPFVPVNVVAETLCAEGSGSQLELLDQLIHGTATAAWAYQEPAPHDALGSIETTIRIEGDSLVIDGVKRPVENAAHATYLLVTGRAGSGLAQVLVPAGAEGMTIEELTSADLTRRFASVRFDGVRVPLDAAVGDLGTADERVTRQLQVALAMHAAETVGAIHRAFELTLGWTADRYSFGRPIGSYQEIKHRMADQVTWREAAHAITDAAIVALDAGAPDATELIHAASAFLGEYGGELLQDCVQIHGGIGVTFEHDLHLFLRRVTVNRATYGTPSEHYRKLGSLATSAGSAA